MLFQVIGTSTPHDFSDQPIAKFALTVESFAKRQVICMSPHPPPPVWCVSWSGISNSTPTNPGIRRLDASLVVLLLSLEEECIVYQRLLYRDGNGQMMETFKWRKSSNDGNGQTIVKVKWWRKPMIKTVKKGQTIDKVNWSKRSELAKLFLILSVTKRNWKGRKSGKDIGQAIRRNRRNRKNSWVES